MKHIIPTLLNPGAGSLDRRPEHHRANRSALFVVGLSHKTAPLDALESIHLQEHEHSELINLLRQSLDECIPLSTCNRTEIYGVARQSKFDVEFYTDLIIDFKAAKEKARREQFYGLAGEEAFRHLFRVAASADSKIVGDSQILGQLRQAYQVAHRHGSTGKITNQLFQRAFKVGKRIRSETELHKGAVSASLVAAELAAKSGGSLADNAVLVIGAGEMARLTTECLIKKGVGKIIVANRTIARAEEMLSSLRPSHVFSGEAVEIFELKRYLNEVDVVISAAGSQRPILDKKDFARLSRSILLVDIAMPRNIAPDVAECEKVTLRNLNDLHDLVGDNYRLRLAELPRVNRIIETELGDFLDWYRLLPFLPPGMKRGIKPTGETRREITGLKTLLKANRPPYGRFDNPAVNIRP